MYKIGTGWLGWSHQDVMATPMACIRDAYEGRMDMLKAIFGSSEKPEPEPIKQKPDVSAKFAAFFADRKAKRDANT